MKFVQARKMAYGISNSWGLETNCTRFFKVISLHDTMKIQHNLIAANKDDNLTASKDADLRYHILPVL